MDQLVAMSIFVNVAEHGGFSAAARRLNMSPASVTRAVTQLEERLGAQLLVRSTRVVQLTDVGERYLFDCQRILSELDEAETHASGSYKAPRGAVTITASVMCGRIVVAPILHRLLDAYPEISITTLFVDRIVHLIDEGIDIAIRFGELPNASLLATRVGSTRRVLCASPDYLSKSGRPMSPQELSNHQTIDLVSMKHHGQWQFHKDGKILSFRPNSRLQVNTPDMAIASALDGRGIVRVASYMVAEEVRCGELEIIMEDYEPPFVPLHVIRREIGRPSGRVRLIYDELVEQLRGNSPRP